MNYSPYQENRPMIKYSVRLALQGRVLRCFAPCLLLMLPSLVLRLIPVDLWTVYLFYEGVPLTGIALASSAISMAASVLALDPMQVKLSAFFMQLNRDAEKLPSPLSVCECFGPGYGRLARGMLLRRAVLTACLLLPLLAGALVPGVAEVLWEEGRCIVNLGSGMMLFLLASVVLGIWASLRYSMVPYLLADFPHLSSREALSRSAAMTRGRLWELLLLQLSFTGWFFLMAATVLIGSVYAYPYVEGTMAAYYLAFRRTGPAGWVAEGGEEDDSEEGDHAAG